MQFKTSEQQITGTSITSELVIAKNEDSITGEFKSHFLLLGDLKVGFIGSLVSLSNVFKTLLFLRVIISTSHSEMYLVANVILRLAFFHWENWDS
jgi:hypothetical protein